VLNILHAVLVHKDRSKTGFVVGKL